MKNSAADGSSAPFMRSFCSLSMITTSQPSMPCAMSWKTRTPRRSTAVGISVFGAITRRSGTPSVFSAWICERATRECRMSPTIATLNAEKSFL